MNKILNHFLLLVFMLVSFQVVALPKADASVPPGTAVLYLYKNGNVNNATWVRIIDTTARAIQGFLISNVSIDAMYLGIAPSSTVYGSETPVAVIPAGATVYMPLPVSGGSRVSVKSTGRTAQYGELDMTGVYY